MTELYSFYWGKTCSSASESFFFYFTVSAKGGGYSLDCQFYPDYWDSTEYTNKTITAAQWSRLEEKLRNIQLSEYSLPDPYLLDGDDNCIEITWLKDDSKYTESFSGNGAEELYDFIIKLID